MTPPPSCRPPPRNSISRGAPRPAQRRSGAGRAGPRRSPGPLSRRGGSSARPCAPRGSLLRGPAALRGPDPAGLSRPQSLHTEQPQRKARRGNVETFLNSHNDSHRSAFFFFLSHNTTVSSPLRNTRAGGGSALPSRW